MKILFVFILILASILCGPSIEAITELNDENYYLFITQHPATFIKFTADWCAYCENFSNIFGDAFYKILLENIDIEFATVDAEKNPKISEFFKITEYPSARLYFENRIYYYNWGANTQKMLEFIKRTINRNPVKIISENTDPEMSEIVNGTLMKAFLIGGDKNDFIEFEKAASNMIDYRYYWINQEIGVNIFPHIKKFPSLVIMNESLFPKTLYVMGQNYLTMLKHLRTERYPTIAELNEETSKIVLSDGERSGVFLFTEDDYYQNDINIANFTEFAEENKDEQFLFFVSKIGTIWPYLLYKNLALTKKDLPRVEIINVKNGVKRYIFCEHFEKNITNSELTLFLSQYKEGIIKQFVKSEEIIEEPVKDPTNFLQKIVGKNFVPSVIENSQDVFVLFIAEECKVCDSVKDTINYLAKILKPQNGIKFCIIDALKNDIEGLSVEYWPLLMLFPANNKNKPVEYKGERTEEEIVAFIKQYSDNFITIPEYGIKDVF